MNIKCNNCNWNYNNDCVSEDKATHESDTQYTNDCIGFLEKDFENRLFKKVRVEVEEVGSGE